jgi:hypothetical protein
MDLQGLDYRKVALGLARARAINGLTMMLVPGVIARPLFGSAGNTAFVRATLRMIGVRDLVLGVGAITTLKEHTMDAEWVGMGAIADAIDAVVALITPGLPLRGRMVALAGGSSAAAGYQASRALAAERDGSEIDT